MKLLYAVQITKSESCQTIIKINKSSNLFKSSNIIIALNSSIAHIHVSTSSNQIEFKANSVTLDGSKCEHYSTACPTCKINLIYMQHNHFNTQHDMLTCDLFMLTCD